MEIYISKVNPTYTEKALAVFLAHRMRKSSLIQVRGVLWRDWRIISQGMKIGKIVTKFSMSKNKKKITYFSCYIFQDFLNNVCGRE